MIPPILRDVCTAIGALVLIANAAFMVYLGVRGAAMAAADWREGREVSGRSSLGEVAATGSTHPAAVPSGGAALGTVRRHLRAVPGSRSGGAA